MKKQKTLAFFGAHPDDESFGTGSTLAQCAISGVKVYCVCSTGGEAGTVSPEHMKGYSSIKELREAELKCAVQALGLAGLIHLGYRDSGMAGSEDNKNPASMAMAPLDEATERVVKIMRQIQPDVVITHDSGGGYGHPDHIATHNAVLKAFQAAGDPKQYPSTGPAFKPSKLYFGVRPRGAMKLIVKLMPLFGQDPKHFGRNRDIDLTRQNGVEYPVHAVVRLSKQAVAMRNKAAACHASQGGGRPPGGARPQGGGQPRGMTFNPFRIMQIINRLQGPRDYFMRGYPSADGRGREKDLFHGVN